MKFFLKICCLFFLSLPLSAQPFGNEWIDYSQDYYKFKISSEGVYKIDSLALVNSGVPLAGLNPQNIQIFARGKEIPIYIEGEGDGVFHSSDFIEFYARNNPAWLDSSLYYGKQNHPNPYYSLVNDTSTYYLTWNNSTSNKRFTPENDTSFSSFSPSSFFYKKVVENYNSNYYHGKPDAVGSHTAEFIPTESWGDNDLKLGGSKTKTLSTPNVYTSGGNAMATTTVLGQSDYRPINNGDHHMEISVRPSSGSYSLLADTIFEGYQKLDFQFSLPINNLGVNTDFRFESINDLGSGADRTTLTFITLKYPHTPDLEGKTSFDLIVPDQVSQTKAYFSFTNFGGVSDIHLYDLTNEKRIKVVSNAGSFQALIPNAGGDKSCHIFSELSTSLINQLTPVNGTGNFNDFNNLFLDSAFLIISHPILWQEAMAYQNHRNITGHNPHLFNVEELYDQFAYGIDKHPLAIRNFVDFAINNSSSPPKYLFLLGKSLKQSLTRKNSLNYRSNLVPTYGNPGSDNMLTSGLNNTIFEPAVATGRLSANSGQEAMWYLQKVQDHESNPPEIWMKNVLHFAGGTSAAQANSFKNYLDNYKATIEDTSFGGNVKTFTKSTTQPIQITLADSIKNLVNTGVSMMTFFGHASTTGGFDQNISNPQDYNNKGKYPLLIGNACYAGDLHKSGNNSVSEEFTIIQDKGMIGFISSVELGIASYLNLYCGELYTNIGQKNYGKGIGLSIKKTINAIQGTGNNNYIQSVCNKMTLHGDPAVKINPHPLPDYEVKASRAYFTPAEVTTDIDSFDLNIVVTNIGKAVNDSVIIEVIRSFPGQSFQDSIITKTVSPVHFRDTISITYPIEKIKGIGLNKFSVYVDSPYLIPEINESNNSFSNTLLIRSGDIIPVIPYEYAIVPEQNIILKASTGYPFSTARDYVFQLDTTDLYNSPIKQEKKINSSGGVVSWSPPMLNNMPDSSVYFWRVSKDSVSSSSGYNWKESSFQYIPTKQGWGQAHFFQYKNDDYLYIDHNRNTRTFDFVNNVKQLRCYTIGNPGFSQLGQIGYWIDTELQDYNGCSWTPAIHVVVIDSLTLEPWGTYGYIPSTNTLTNANHQFGNANNYPSCRSRVEKYFIFRPSDTTQMNDMANMLNTQVPNGYYVMAYTWRWGNFTQWTPAAMNAFLNLGADTVQYLNDTLPYIFFGKKGSPGTVQEMVGSHKNATLSFTTTLSNNASFGNITSELLGPATRWDSLFWRSHPRETPSVDSIHLSISGVDINGQETTLIPYIASDSTDIRISNTINANQHPYLKLNAITFDDSLQTPAQMDRWQVTYEGVPEAALSPKIKYSFHADTVQAGDEIKFSIAVKNISDYDMDSLLIGYKVLDRYNKIHNISYPRQGPLLADSVMITSIKIPTRGFSGLNTLFIEVNPDNDQLEQYHFNNLGQVNFFVQSDNINPLLDVTFDGTHILDGDIVSPSPEIVVQLTDENKYLALDDTSDYAVYITNPDGQRNRIHFKKNLSDREGIEFIPASLPENSAKLIYNPTFKKDGIYKLRVQAYDKSGNASGDIDYEISFEVIQKSSITEILNYPNPFSTSTRFVFTLTGSKIPDIFKIQILTVTGVVVKEISKEELGPIRIGRNVSEYTWNGTDEFGDPLGNGIYLYRVITHINGEDIEHRETEADRYFHKGFGKMYLMR